jgi:hypothetical protein
MILSQRYFYFPATPPFATSTNQSYKTKVEMKPYDILILEERAKVPPTSWRDIETKYRAAGGITTGHKDISSNRYHKLKAINDEMTAEQVSLCHLSTVEA